MLDMIAATEYASALGYDPDKLFTRYRSYAIFTIALELHLHRVTDPGRKAGHEDFTHSSVDLARISAADVARIRAAAGRDADVVLTTPAEAYEHAEDAEVILGLVPRSLFRAAPKLRWVQATSSGVDAFLYPEFRDSDVILTSEKGMVGEHLADHAFGLLLMLTRQLTTAYKIGPDSWNHRPDLRRHQVELSGLTMGIIGFGGTGRAVARRAHAFGMIVRPSTVMPCPTRRKSPR